MATKRPATRSATSEENEVEVKVPKLAGPFGSSDEFSDLVLIVGNENLHVHKTVLALSSPVFKRMFLSGGFKERDAQKIPLPGKKLETFVPFLELMYPVTANKPITDDNVVDMVSLADEYQVEHIQKKCRDYINTQIKELGDSLSIEQSLKYLWMCERDPDSTNHDLLVDWVAFSRFDEIQSSEVYSSLSDTSVKKIALKRCEHLERTLASKMTSLTQTKRDLDSLTKNVDKLKIKTLNFLDKIRRVFCFGGYNKKCMELSNQLEFLIYQWENC